MISFFSRFATFFFTWLVIPLTILTYCLFTFWAPELLWIEYLYKILLSSTVGYFTNFLAVKMLFKPKKKTAFGRIGLVPSRKDVLAHDLGQLISSQFFAVEDIIEYITKERVVENLLTDCEKSLDQALANPKTRILITDKIISLVTVLTPKIETFMLTLSKQNAVQFLEKHIDVHKTVKAVLDLVEERIQNKSIDMNSVAAVIAEVLHKNTPEIARNIARVLDEYIDGLGFFKRLSMRAAMSLFNVSQKHIENKIYEAFSSEKFRNEIYGIIEKGTIELIDYFKSPEGSTRLNSVYAFILEELSELFRTRGAGKIAHIIKKFLQENRSWERIEHFVMLVTGFFKRNVRRFLTDVRLVRFLNTVMPSILQHIDIENIVAEKVKAFDTDDLEKLVLEVSGEHLGMIQVWGGVLGGFAGVALFNMPLFLYIIGGILLLWAVETILTKS